MNIWCKVWSRMMVPTNLLHLCILSEQHLAEEIHRFKIRLHRAHKYRKRCKVLWKRCKAAVLKCIALGNRLGLCKGKGGFNLLRRERKQSPGE